MKCSVLETHVPKSRSSILDRVRKPRKLQKLRGYYLSNTTQQMLVGELNTIRWPGLLRVNPAEVQENFHQLLYN